jgi:Fanconi anemia group M protein
MQEKPKIIADRREKNSLVISELVALGCEVELKHLKVADFLIKGIAIERKTVSDFINSMINKRLIRQLEEIKQYPRSLLIIEGIDEQELYSDEPHSSVNGNAIRGFLLSIVLKFQIPIIFTKNYEDTAKFLNLMARKQKREISIRATKKARTKKEQLQFILEGFPGIGPKTAKKLLKKYKTLKAIINTPLSQLQEDIGKKADIFKILNDAY